MYDLEMIKEMGFCRGIENYSRHLTGKPPGAPPPTLLDYLPKTRLWSLTNRTRPFRSSARCIKATVREKGTLVEYGFRLPSAMDNRPLNFEEFEARSGRRFTFRRRREITN
jgi:excinuclease ABC subunit B